MIVRCKNRDLVYLKINTIDMKKQVLFGAAFLFIVCSVTSCEKLGGCKKCKDVTYENNSVVFSSPETEYCGTDLLIKEATEDVPIGSQIIRVECR
jgi:hypothetical protein